MVKWLEQLGYDAESSHKVVSSRLGFAIRPLENSCQPSSKWVPFFELGKDKAAKGEGWVSAFNFLCPRYSGTPTLTALRLWETFTLFIVAKTKFFQANQFLNTRNWQEIQNQLKSCQNNFILYLFLFQKLNIHNTLLQQSE